MPESERLYDTETLIQVHHADAAFVRYMISLFIKHMAESNENLEKACNENDWMKVYFYAHKMKSSIDLFNLNKLKELVRKVEDNAKNNIATKTLSGDVNFISTYIKNCILAMKSDFNM